MPRVTRQDSPTTWLILIGFLLAATPASALHVRDCSSICREFAPRSWEQAYDLTAADDEVANPLGYVAFRRLGLRYLANDEHALMLTRIGWTFEKRNGVPVLLPPSSPELTCTLHRKAVDTMVAQGKMSGDFGENDRIDLAIPFERRERDASGNIVFQFVRPGIDPWPPLGEWEVATGERQISHAFFYSVVATGRFPLFPGTFYHHDLAHATELLRSPEMMRTTRAYARTMSPEPHPNLTFAVPEPETLHYRDLLHAGPGQRRSHVLSEWFSVPDIAFAPAIRALVPEPFAAKETASVGNQLLVWEAMSASQQVARAEKLLREAPAMLIRMGGGLRDPYNLAVYGGQPDRMDASLKSLKQSLSSPQSREDYYLPATERPPMPEYAGETTLATETLHGQLLLLRHALDGRKAPVSREHDAAIRDIAVRIEVALAAAVQLQITPDDIVRDARVKAPDPDSRTFPYLKSYTRRTGFTFFAFDLYRQK